MRTIIRSKYVDIVASSCATYFCLEVPREKRIKIKVLAIWPQRGSPKWPLPMATIFPRSSLKPIIWPFDHWTCLWCFEKFSGTDLKITHSTKKTSLARSFLRRPICIWNVFRFPFEVTSGSYSLPFFLN
jgi:hypothetical protein